MRKLSFITMLLFCVTATFAQKGKLTQATSYLNQQKLDQAKKLVDEAIKHEACVNFDKAYFVKGQIYQAIFESTNADYRKLDANALEKAWEAYQKVIELDVKKKYEKQLATQYSNLIADYTNQAVDRYNKEDYKGALTAFKRVLEIENSPILTQNQPAKVDTAVIFNTAVAAQKAGDYATAETYYKKTLELNYEPARTYAMLANVLKEQGKEEEAISYLHKGYELFPDNSYMLVELINYYLNSGESEKAEVYLDAAIKQDPNNASFYRAKGTLYEKMKQQDKAKAMFEKTLELDPKDFYSQIMLSNYKLDQVNALASKVNDIVDVNEYNKEIEKVFEGYNALIPDFEKCLELKPDDKNAMQVLKELYFKLRERNPQYLEKYQEIKDKLDNAE